MSASKDKYRALCESETSIPLFSQAWWLDAVAGCEGWGVSLVEKGGKVVASMPFARRKRFGRLILDQPPLTQTLGPWVREVDAKLSSRLSRQKHLMQQLIEFLPPYDRFCSNWHFSQTNWLPFYWAGFSQTTRYTYRLPELSNHDKLWGGLRENIRGDIRKAEGRFELQFRTNPGIDDFLSLSDKTFARQGKKFPYSNDLILRLDKACADKDARRIFIVEDSKGRAHAAVYVVWDRNSAYYLMGGGDPDLRNSGAASLCVWEAIKFASTVTKSFDFEGSMHEPIERFFRAFGAEQRPYFEVSHTPSKLIKAAIQVREILR